MGNRLDSVDGAYLSPEAILVIRLRSEFVEFFFEVGPDYAFEYFLHCI